MATEPTAAERIAHPTARAMQAWASDGSVDVQEGRAMGQRTGPRADADWNMTQPSEVVLAGREAAFKVRRVLVDFQHQVSRYATRLGRLMPLLAWLRGLLEERTAALSNAKRETEAQLDSLPADLAAHRQDTRRGARLGLLLVVLLGIGDVAFFEAVLEMAGLSTLTTWAIACVVGLGQLMSMHMVGDLFAQSSAAWRRARLLVVALVIPAAALIVTTAILRADYSASQEALAGASSGFAPFGVMVVAYAAIQALLDALAFALGAKFGNPLVKAVTSARAADRRLATSCIVLAWGVQRIDGRRAALLAAGLGWCEKAKAIAKEQWESGAARIVAVYVGIGENAAEEARSVFADQLAANGGGAAQKALDHALEDVLDEIERARLRLEVAAGASQADTANGSNHNGNNHHGSDRISLKRVKKAS